MNDKIPQLEDGYTRVNNPYLDALVKAWDISPARRCQILIARRSWGYGKATCDLRPRDFVKYCGIRHNNVHREIQRGIERKYFYTIHADGISGTRYKVNKKFWEWFIPSMRMLPSTQRRNTIRTDGKYKKKEKKKENTYSDPYSPNPKKPNVEFAYRIRVPIPPGIFLTDKMRAYATSKGIPNDEHDFMYERFVTHHTANGTKWKDWSAAWQKWVQNDIKFYRTKPENAFDVIRKRRQSDRSKRRQSDRSTGESGRIHEQTDQT